jgi:gluconokinase
MKVADLRSPYDKVEGLVYFGRMLDKIRLHSQSKLPQDYHENLGKGFDGRCVDFLRVAYSEIVEQVRKGGSDREILEWCFEKGRKPSDEEIEVWNEFLRKRGWNDEMSARLVTRKKEIGAENRGDIQTFFDFIDADEGRK